MRVAWVVFTSLCRVSVVIWHAGLAVESFQIFDLSTGYQVDIAMAASLIVLHPKGSEASDEVLLC